MKLQPLMLAIQSLSPQQLYQSTKAKKEYKLAHNECAMCGNRKYLEVHHVEPVHVNPARAADPLNFITLCDGPRGSNSACHRYFGHFGNFRSKYNPVIREQCVLNRLIMQDQDPDRSFLFPAELMLMEFSLCEGVSTEAFAHRVNTLSNHLHL